MNCILFSSESMIFWQILSILGKYISLKAFRKYTLDFWYESSVGNVDTISNKNKNLILNIK